MKKKKNGLLLIVGISAVFLVTVLVRFMVIKTEASSGIDNFIERCYEVALQRKPDEEGRQYWKNLIYGKQKVGSTVAYEFIFSKEYVERNKTNEEFVNDLYHMFMGRDPEQDGYTFWMNNIANGMNREEVFAGFGNSTEFFDICSGYGITAGYYDKAYSLEQINNVNLFVERMYNVSLNRQGDYEGQIYWVKGMINGSLSGSQCAANFINSKEYKENNLSDDEYVENLYYAFMGRKSDDGGKKYWLDALEKREKTRDQVLQGFTESAEFKEICNNYKIPVGEYKATDVAPNKPTPLPDTQNPYNNIVEFSMFIDKGDPYYFGKSNTNVIKERIARKTGAKIDEQFLSGETSYEALNRMKVTNTYPDYISLHNDFDGFEKLYRNGKLVAWDSYLEKYPNLKKLYSEKEWDNMRMDDGHIYWVDFETRMQGDPKQKNHNDEAFWIQVRVLEWAGYPNIQSVDEYFNLLERYYETHKTFTDPSSGYERKIIPFTILTEDWRYFCLENPPYFLDGYENDGSVIVNPKTLKVVDYNTTYTAQRYYKKLNEEYHKGILDSEFATQSYDQYIAKLSCGMVLGMVDQTWDFNYTVSSELKEYGLDKIGCEYIPLGITIDKGMEQRWHTYYPAYVDSPTESGLAVSTNCSDYDRAFRLINDMLNQDIHNLRFWGIAGVDYLIDENGLFYRTDEMRNNIDSKNYHYEHMCEYSYMPILYGTSTDGINAMMPEEQKSEFFASLSEPVIKCFNAYGVDGYAEMIGSVKEVPPVWFPMWSYSNNLDYNTVAFRSYQKMGNTKHEWLPKVIIYSDFDSTWNNYMDAYSRCNPEDFLNEMQAELDRRIEKSQK